MKKEYKKINFIKKDSNAFQFDIVKYEDILQRKPLKHNQFDFHKISFFVLLLFTENKGKYNLNFKDYSFKKGTLFTLRKDNIHKFYKNNGKGTLLLFTENFIVNHANEAEASKMFLLFNEMLASPILHLVEKEYKEIELLVHLISEEFHAINDDYSSDIIRNYIQIMITKLFRIKSKNNLVIHKNNKYLSMFMELQKLIEQECFNNKKVSFYAKKMGVTTKTLNNVTQSIIHKSAKSYINDIIIIQSKRLIIKSHDTLTEIAYQVGFDEPSNFFKFFRKMEGISPKQFREKHQSE